MLNVLVTGATGFVGRQLVPSLLAAGYRVLCPVSQRVDGLDARQVVIPRLEVMHDWHDLLQGIDVVIHLAAKVHVMKGGVPLDEFCKVNSWATNNLAEQAARCGVKRFIFLSTIKVNGEWTTKGLPFTEERVSEPKDPYAKSKQLAEQGLLALAQHTAMDVVIVRPSLIFGPGVKANFLKMMQLVDKGWPLPFGLVHNKRHFVSIENLISALIAVLHEPKAANQIYLVADNEAWSLSELLRFLAKEMGKKSLLFPVPGLLGALKLVGLSALSTRLFSSLEVSNEKIKHQLGWSPPVSSAEGMSKTVRWYQQQY
jgi:nucleoside-diphosphate-sugar epimerase